MNHTLYIPALKEYLDIYIPKRKLLTKEQALALETKKQLYRNPKPKYKYYKKF